MEVPLCRAIWGSNYVDWAYKNANGKAGVILTIWSTDCFVKMSSWFTEGLLVVNDYWKIDGSQSGNGGVSDGRDMEIFDEFITLIGLIELPLTNRYFTWYMHNGTCKSKLDRMFVNSEWIEK
ncbi:hypothetical protein ACS0TY_028418 [Phlomoides rotata]